jgi:hypothetical protein
VVRRWVGEVMRWWDDELVIDVIDRCASPMLSGASNLGDGWPVGHATSRCVVFFIWALATSSVLYLMVMAIFHFGRPHPPPTSTTHIHHPHPPPTSTTHIHHPHPPPTSTTHIHRPHPPPTCQVWVYEPNYGSAARAPASVRTPGGSRSEHGSDRQEVQPGAEQVG